jgi:hypothetical protein
MFDVVGAVVGSAAVLGPFLMIVGIVWVRGKHQLEEKRIEAGKFQQVDRGAAHRDERVEELEERVRVLERIVTDREGGYGLASKIEALRDERPLSTRIEEREPGARV